MKTLTLITIGDHLLGSRATGADFRSHWASLFELTYRAKIGVNRFARFVASSQLCLAFVFAALLVPRKSFALLDFIGETAKDSAKAAAYLDSARDLVNEIDESSSLASATQNLLVREKKLRTEFERGSQVGVEGSALFTPHDWTSKRLDENLRYTSRFVKRARRLLVSTGLVGVEVATALNTAETNAALNEVIKNQQADLLLRHEERIKAEERRAEWQNFIEQERLVRRRWAEP